MSDEEELYDEFGNYIGPDLESSDEEESEPEDNDNNSQEDDAASDVSEDDPMALSNVNTANQELVEHDGREAGVVAEPMSAIVLHEDKEHYPSAEQVFGEEVRTAVLDEDAMEIETPLVEPLSTKSIHAKSIHSHMESAAEAFAYDDTYLSVQLSNETTRTRRGIAVVGHFHHGKTSLMDLLLEPTLKEQSWNFPSNSKSTASASISSKTFKTPHAFGPKYTDILQTERDRQMSLVSTPLTALFPDTRGKNYALTFLDCPGHVQFHDESVAALQAMDGALLVVDAVEGIMLHTEMVIRQIVSQGLPIVLCITKVDRLMVELKLPPNDCYYKLQHVIESVNEFVQQVSMGRYPILSPNRGNVAFASAQHGWIFTLESFAQVYLEHYDHLGENLSAHDLAQRLWGDAYMDPQEGTFHRAAHQCPSMADAGDNMEPLMINRTFVALILEPLYKIYSACLAEREPDVRELLRTVGVFLSRDELRASARPLLRSALQNFLASAHGGLVDALVRHVPCPSVAAPAKIARCYTGPAEGNSNPRVQAMKDCDPRGPLVIHAVKQYPATDDGQSFFTLGRIYSGTVRPQTTVKILGESYTPDEDDEDVSIATVEGVFIPRGPLQTEVTIAKAGNWVLLQGVDASISKTATIVGINDGDQAEDFHIFAPLKFHQAGGESIMKLAIEPLNPAELPKMVEGLRRVSKAYPMVKTKVEESGEHVVLGTGELYMDCVMHDLRQVYSDIEVKVADPIVAFRETVVDTSSIKCFAETANKRNKLTFIAEPLDDGLADKLEAGKVKPHVWDSKKLGRFFQSNYNWDLLSSRSVWAFGDSPTNGTNILMDDTLPSDIDKKLLNTCKSSIVQGFQWAMREGPLCEEQVRGTKLKLLDVSLADKPIYRGGGQVIPTSRRTVHSSLLTATPRLMEPVYNVQIQCPGSMVEAIQPVLARRRGHIVQDRPIAGTTLYSVRGFIPVLDSFGFETDLRTFTQGQAMVHSVFDHWSIVPGDPLDKSIILHPLEPSPPHCLARELLIKTRRRKGLAEDVTITKFFDEAMKSQLMTDETLISEAKQ